MTIIVRDLMIENPELEEMGFGEESMGYNAIAADFQGQRRWTDHFPNGDFMEVVERVTGEELTGKAENGIIHLINSGSAALDRTGQQQKDGKPVMNN